MNFLVIVEGFSGYKGEYLENNVYACVHIYFIFHQRSGMIYGDKEINI